MDRLRKDLFPVEGIRGHLVAAGTKLQQGDADGALAEYQAGRALLEADGRCDSEEGAGVLLGIGGARLLQNDLDGAASAYAESRQVLTRIGALDSLDGANALTALGNVRLRQQQPDAALEAWLEARRVRAALGLLETGEGASLLTNVGIVRRMLGDLEGASAAYTEARELHVATASRCSGMLTPAMTPRVGAPSAVAVVDPQQLLTQTPRPTSAGARTSSGLEKLKPEDLDLMAASFEQEKDMMQATFTLDTPQGAELMMNLGIVRRMQGDLEGAAAAYREARRIDAATNPDAGTTVGLQTPLASARGAGPGQRPQTPLISPSSASASGSSGGTAPQLRPVTPLATPTGLIPGKIPESNEVLQPKHLAAGSPIAAIRQAHRLDAKLENLKQM